MIEARAIARFVRVAPRKARLVADLIRGREVEKALVEVRFCRKRAARPIEKVLRSAVANAEQKGKVNLKSLRVDRIWVDEGPTLKRYRPRAMGRATMIRKRTSHITVCLRGEEEKKRKGRPKREA